LRAHICGLVPASDVNWLATYPDSPWRVIWMLSF
jgi:hypothetical protein